MLVTWGEETGQTVHGLYGLYSLYTVYSKMSKLWNISWIHLQNPTFVIFAELKIYYKNYFCTRNIRICCLFIFQFRVAESQPQGVSLNLSQVLHCMVCLPDPAQQLKSYGTRRAMAEPPAQSHRVLVLFSRLGRRLCLQAELCTSASGSSATQVFGDMMNPFLCKDCRLLF